MKSPELLSPVGNRDMCLAAIHNGADAVYVGFPHFNARGRSHDHGMEELEELVRLCHRQGVKIFIALNVLLFERELREILPDLRRVLALGVDAFIVQDLGLARLIGFLAPGQALHASTQMTVSNHEAIALTEDLGLRRYVLAREVSLPEMEAIRRNTDKELEVFVHGALCVSYSGQCLTSEGFGGRSANRGQCAQSCRMEYDLLVDGEARDLRGRNFLVSPLDLCGLGEVEELMRLGIDSFKIEGRLKSPEYVAASTALYRKAITGEPPSPEERSGLAVTYSRGFFSGWLHGVDHQALVDGHHGSHRGQRIGTVLRTAPGGKGLLLDGQGLRPGDGLLFLHRPSAAAETHGAAPSAVAAAAPSFSPSASPRPLPAASGKPRKREWGSRVYQIEAHPKGQAVFLAHDFPYGEIPIGTEVYLNDRPGLEAEWKRSYTDRSRLRLPRLSAFLLGRLGEPLSLTYRLEDRFAGAEGDAPQVTVTAGEPLRPALQAAARFRAEEVRKELGAVQGAGFRLEEIRLDLDPSAFLPRPVLRGLRQEALIRLQGLLHRPPPALRSEEEALLFLETGGESLPSAATLGPAAPSAFASDPRAPAPPPGSALRLLLRERAQIEALPHLARAGLPLDAVYLDFEQGKDFKPAAEEVRALGIRVGIATTRILKPGEYHHFKVIEASRPDLILIRNLGALHYFREKPFPLAGDFSLNAANSLTARYLLGKGLSSLCPSYDLNQWQLSDLLEAVGGAPFEITLHQHLPSFHMEHCVFAAFLSQGRSFRDCGKPCERHRVELRDAKGALHPLKADQECRNTMFQGEAQSSARLVPALQARGVRLYRLEFLFDGAEEVRRKALLYAALLEGRMEGEDLFGALQAVERYGVGEGQLHKAAIYRDRKKSA